MTAESRIAMIESIKDDLKKLSNVSALQHSKLTFLIDRCIRRQKKLAYPKDQPFVTVIHNDFWVNNILIQYDGETPIFVKIIDFQLISCDSLAHDVLFFMLTSVKDDCFETMIDMWLNFYHEKFFQHLVALKCPTEAYSFDK